MGFIPDSVPVFAGAFVISRDGRILCQLRDDKPEIRFPGFWTASPGGHLEKGEDPYDAIRRELREEFEIEVEGLLQLATFVEPAGEESGVYHIFRADLATPLAEVRCNEGQRAEFYTPEDALNLKLHPLSKTILTELLTIIEKR